MSYGQDVEETEEWNRFRDSGKVEDYLRYRNCCSGEEVREYSGRNNRNPQKEQDRFS